MTTYTTIQLRRGTAAQWTAANPTLGIGEYGHETDTRKSKVGNGTAAWNDLPYLAGATAVTAIPVKTDGYAATVGDLVRCDATAGGFTVTLPDGPMDESQIVVKKIDTSTNTVIVQRSGTDVFNVAGGVSLMELSIPGETVTLLYKSGIWYVVSHGFSKAGLDTRYVTQGTFPVSGWYGIKDSNGANSLVLMNNSDAVNYWVVSNAATGGGVQLRANGTDADISAGIRSRGTGSVIMYSGAGEIISSFQPQTSAVNYWRIDNSGAGTALKAWAAGTDTDISIDLIPKGAGTVKANGVTLITGSAPSITDPKVNRIMDSAGNVLIGSLPASNAVNYLQVSNATAGNNPVFEAAGSDSNISIYMRGKGTGTLIPLADIQSVNAGFKIGTGTTQKIGFWNATPAVQPAAVADATDAATTQTQLNALLARLRTIGIIAT